MGWKNSIWAGSTLLALAACDSAGGLRPSEGGVLAPAGRPGSQQSVDGLTVGHRLMAAGQYELALKSYLRAASEQGVNVDVVRLGRPDRSGHEIGSEDRHLVARLVARETLGARLSFGDRSPELVQVVEVFVGRDRQHAAR